MARSSEHANIAPKHLKHVFISANSKPNPINTLKFPTLEAKDRTREYNESRHVIIPTRTEYLYDTPQIQWRDIYHERQKLYEADLYLRTVLRVSRIRSKELEEDWKILEFKEKEFRKNIVHFNEFVSTNQEKRIRAMQRIEESQLLYNRRCHDIDQLRVKMDDFHFIKSHREEQIKRYKIYEAFLDSVVVSSNRDLKDAYAVIKRYSTIQDAKKDILKEQNKRIDEIQNAKQELIDLTSEKMTILMALSVDVSKLVNRYRRAKSRALEWDTIVAKIKEHTLKRLIEVENVKMCAEKVYCKLCARYSDNCYNPNASLEEKFLLIKSSLYILKRAVKEAPGIPLMKQKEKKRFGVKKLTGRRVKDRPTK